VVSEATGLHRIRSPQLCRKAARAYETAGCRRGGRTGWSEYEGAPLAKRDVLAVRSLAGELPAVLIPTAAEITVLLLEKEPESYASAARRLLARVATERAVPLRRLADVARLLAELEADPAPMEAGKKLIAAVAKP